MQICDVCAKKFKPKVYWQKHCSPNCKQAAWALKKVNSRVQKKNKN